MYSKRITGFSIKSTFATSLAQYSYPQFFIKKINHALLKRMGSQSPLIKWLHIFLGVCYKSAGGCCNLCFSWHVCVMHPAFPVGI